MDPKPITMQEIVDNNSFFLEDVVLAFTINWREYIRGAAKYESFKSYLSAQADHGEGLNQILAEYVLMKEFSR